MRWWLGGGGVLLSTPPLGTSNCHLKHALRRHFSCCISQCREGWGCFPPHPLPTRYFKLLPQWEILRKLFSTFLFYSFQGLYIPLLQRILRHVWLLNGFQIQLLWLDPIHIIAFRLVQYGSHLRACTFTTPRSSVNIKTKKNSKFVCPSGFDRILFSVKTL